MTPATSTLMGIPIECRLRIYNYVFDTEDVMDEIDLRTFQPRHWAGVHPLLLTSSNVHHEARAQFRRTLRLDDHLGIAPYCRLRQDTHLRIASSCELKDRLSSFTVMSITRVYIGGKQYDPWTKTPIANIVNKRNFPRLI